MELRRFQNDKYPGAAGLAEAANKILTHGSAQQEKGTVTEFPDERTVRYYISEGLIPASSERRGTSTVFGYLHLLALLTIKKLQADNLPIKKIREIIGGKTEAELETLLGESEGKNEAQQYLESLLLTPSAPMRSLSSAPPQQAMFSRAAVPASLSQPPDAAPAEPPKSWSRFEVARGVELNLSDDLAPDEAEANGIIAAIERIIRSVVRR